ncbi:unnamed protein product [Meganyctiphanes norvegica]|uniref:C2H2-type domain-containing protein n=1 Tax=Meganyctiphanes norvegica TaxID=48144 RepID=A0AAV2SIR1_MEGNR
MDPHKKIKQEVVDSEETNPVYHIKVRVEGHPFQLEHKQKKHVRTEFGANIEPRMKVKQEVGDIKSEMDVHIKEHPVDIETCSNTFDKEYLSQDIHCAQQRISRGEKPCKCRHCDNILSQKCTKIKKQRMPIQTNKEKLYQCSHCDKYFGYKYNLTRHMQIHTMVMNNHVSHTNAAIVAKT